MTKTGNEDHTYCLAVAIMVPMLGMDNLAYSGTKAVIIAAILILGTITIISPPIAVTATDPVFSFTTIDFPGATQTSANGINNAGQIVGFYGPGGSRHGFLLSSGSFSTIDFPGATQTHGDGINNAGQIVGGFCGGVGISCFFGNNNGFLLSSGTFSTIPNFSGAVATNANGLNNVGQIVGNFEFPSGEIESYLLPSGCFSSSCMSEIKFPGSSTTGTLALGINDLGQVVGEFCTGATCGHGFLLSSGTFSTFDFPGATATVPQGINNAGLVVGFYFDSTGITHGFLLSSGSFSTIDFPGATQTQALAINNAGQIVGLYVDSAGTLHGFLATPLLPFSSFSSEVQAQIEEQDQTPTPSLEAEGTFTLGAGNDGINPPGEPVTVQIGSFQATIPPNSFVQEESTFEFKGIIASTPIEMEIKPVQGLIDTFEFDFKAQTNACTLPNPVTVKLTIGDDSGQTSVTPEINC